MSRVDARGCAITGATPAGLAAYEQGVQRFLGWRVGVDEAMARALQHAPRFVMAHVLQAWLLACSRDPRQVRRALPVLARAETLPSNERERQHLGAIAAVLSDDYEAARSRLGHLLREHPRDLLALHAAHAFDHVVGDTATMRDRVQAVLPHWPRALPGCHAVLAMHAFGLEECGDYVGAEAAARAALELDPSDARAHHSMAHIFEMTNRPQDGLRWMQANRDAWATGTVVATHGWWHTALFHLAQGDGRAALAVYDAFIFVPGTRAVGDLIDAAALLWRIALAGGDVGYARWRALADAWSPHIDDGFCSFNDLHAMLAFVGASDELLARAMEEFLTQAQARQTRHGLSTREMGLPACRALMAFGRGHDTLAITLLASLPGTVPRLGGSHAQRDLLRLTLRKAVGRVLRPSRGERDALREAQDA